MHDCVDDSENSLRCKIIELPSIRIDGLLLVNAIKRNLNFCVSEYGLSKVPKTYGKTAKFQAKKCMKGLTHVTSGQICWWE